MSGFTQIELDTLQWLAEGKCQEDIAIIRGVSLSTVHGQLQRIRVKMDALNSAHCVAIAMRNNLIK